MLIETILDKASQKFPDKAAVWFSNKWITYGEIFLKCNKVAYFLSQTGIKRGDRIALLYENNVDYIISYYAILKADAVVVALNTELLSDSIQVILNHCNVTGIIVSQKYLSRISQIANNVKDLRLIIVGDSASTEDHLFSFKTETTDLQSIYNQSTVPEICNKSIDIDLSSIVYTSGSTGKPKGVMLSHLNIVQNSKSIVHYLQLTDRDRIMVVLPFYYVYGTTLFNTHFMSCGSVVIDNRFAYPNLVLEIMQKQEVTGFAGVPSTFVYLLNKSAIRDHIPFKSLRYMTQAGGHMAVSVQEEIVELIAPAKLIIMYGATELSPRLTWLPPGRWSEKKGSIGIPIPNTEAFIADEDGNRLSIDEEGEIVGRGSNVMMGYWKDPEATSQVIRNGLYYTGDIGRMDDEGFIYVVGRSKDMLKIGGNRVSTKEIEDAILQVESIEEVAVIGVTDPFLGEVAKAFVVTKNNSLLEENILKQALSLKLPNYKIPKHFEFLTSLPKNESGKILKPLLADKSKS